MGTKTIGIREDVYERLRDRKRDDESFTDLVDRLLEESTPDWREGFGTLPETDAEDLEGLVLESRSGLNEGLSTRQDEAIAQLVAGEIDSAGGEDVAGAADDEPDTSHEDDAA